MEEHYFAAAEAGKWAQRFDHQIEELTKYHESILLKIEGKMKPNLSFEPEEEREARLITDLTDYFREGRDEHKRLVFVASAIFEYAYHLRRLEKIVDQVQQRGMSPEEWKGEANASGREAKVSAQE